MIRYKFLVIGYDEKLKKYSYPDIIYSNIEFKDEYYDKKTGDRGIKESIEIALRSYNHHYRDMCLKGVVIGRFDEDKKNPKEIVELFNNFTLEEANNWYKNCWDANAHGAIGNIDSDWELSDLSPDDRFISVDKFLPEDLCMCLYPGLSDGLSYTKDCICKFDDGTMKYSYRRMINPRSEKDKLEWIEEWSKRQLSNKESLCSKVPAYHWAMPKSFANRVVSWRWFKEGEKTVDYM